MFSRHLSCVPLMPGSGGMIISKNRHLHLCGICHLMVKTDMNKTIIMNMCEIAAVVKQ